MTSESIEAWRSCAVAFECFAESAACIMPVCVCAAERGSGGIVAVCWLSFQSVD